MSMIGKSLAHYEITAEIGKGGMGEVYQAKDTKLGRDVAIKVLPQEFAKDTERVVRFQREAKLLASLNHPNIAAIHGLEESDGIHFLVLELVEGDTLASRIEGGPIPVEKSLKLGLQIAEALEAAHEKGVIHRDLKPANIKVTPDGKVKVLDFGLAKAYVGDPENINLSNSPTLSDMATQQGVILGTAAFMPPEQAKGKTVDKRADIWAFGVVLFEMLTGRQLFTGETVSETLAAVIKSEPDWNSLPPNLHPRIRLMLERCLEKDPKNRYGVVNDARVDIDKALTDPGGVYAQPVAAAEPHGNLRSVISWIAAAVVFTAIIVGVLIWNLRAPGPRQVIRLDHELPESQQFSDLKYPALAVSPDGKQLAYSTRAGIYLRSMDELNARLIIGTEENPTTPFFSPDGQSIGYWSLSAHQLKKISINGGVSLPLCDVGVVTGGYWNTDGTIVYGDYPGKIMEVPDNGGEPKPLITEKFGLLAGAQILPDGKSLLYFISAGGDTKVVVKSLESGETKELFPGHHPYYLSTGYIVYVADANLFAVPFDADTLEVAGKHVPMGQSIWRLSPGNAPQYAVSNGGTLVYLQGVNTTATSGRTLVWVDFEGKIEELDAPPRIYLFPKISPDGTRVAFAIVDPEIGNIDIWVLDLERKTLARLTTDEGINIQLIWTPNSKKIVFCTNRDSRYGSIYWRAADGTGKDEQLFSMPNLTVFPYSWSKDGKTLVMGETDGTLDASASAAIWDIGILSMEGDHIRTPLLHEEYAEVQPQVSPDGQWIAYCSSETGQNNAEVYVRPFPDVDKGKIQVSTNGGLSPRWTPDGKKLLYLNSQNELMIVTVETEPTLKLGTPRILFESKYVGDTASEGTVWDIHPDGKRLLMMQNPGSPDEEDSAGGPKKITIVLNWDEELKQHVPVE